MSTMLLIILLFVLFAIGIWIGSWFERAKVKTLRDVLTPKEGRGLNQITRDAVMQLQNEIVRSGAVKLEKLPGGKVRVTLKVVR